MDLGQGVESSGKTVRLCELLDEIVPAKEKAVVFATRKDVIRASERSRASRRSLVAFFGKTTAHSGVFRSHDVSCILIDTFGCMHAASLSVPTPPRTAMVQWVPVGQRESSMIHDVRRGKKQMGYVHSEAERGLCWLETKVNNNSTWAFVK